MDYPCIATSPSAFVRQIAASYLPHGYQFYVTGHVPKRYRGRPEELDRRLVQKFGVDISKSLRSKHRSQGMAAVRYIRSGTFWALLCTAGRHRFFEEHEEVYDIRRRPLTFHGYEVRLVEDRPRVRIERHEYQRLNGHLLGMCTRPKYRGVQPMALAIKRLTPFDPYREVIAQFARLMRQVNRRRRSQGLLPVPLDMVKLRRPNLHGPRMVPSMPATKPLHLEGTNLNHPSLDGSQQAARPRGSRVGADAAQRVTALDAEAEQVRCGYEDGMDLSLHQGSLSLVTTAILVPPS